MDKDLEKLVAAHAADDHSPPEHVVQQWHSAIDEAAALERQRAQAASKHWHPGSFFWGVAVTAALAIGIGIGMNVANDQATPDAHQDPILTASTAPAGALPVAFTRGLQVHLRDSKAQIASLSNTTDRTTLVLQLIGQNRMYELAAENNGAPKLARVLRAFEPILLQLAATDIAPEDAEALRAQLAFELNVMLTKLARESSDDAQTT
jgi:hypothetical protein